MDFKSGDIANGDVLIEEDSIGDVVTRLKAPMPR